MTQTTPIHEDPEQVLEQSPSAISAERLGQTFSQEWAKIERNQLFWRWAVLGGVGLVILCGTYFANAAVDKWQATVDHFESVHECHDAEEKYANEQRSLQAQRIAVLEKKNLTLEFQVTNSYKLHYNLRESCRRVLDQQEGKPLNWPQEMKQARFELDRVLSVLQVNKGIISSSSP